MRRWIGIGLVSAIVISGVAYLTLPRAAEPSSNTSNRFGVLVYEGEPWPHSYHEERRTACEEETQDWRYRECIERIHDHAVGFGNASRSSGPDISLIRRANEGDPEASLKYGYHLVGKSGVENTVPNDAIPYLMTAALAGDIGAHVQLALIEADWKKDGDPIRAWAHFDVALRELPEDHPDRGHSERRFTRTDAELTNIQRNQAITLSAQFRETMRANGNTLK